MHLPFSQRPDNRVDAQNGHVSVCAFLEKSLKHLDFDFPFVAGRRFQGQLFQFAVRGGGLGAELARKALFEVAVQVILQGRPVLVVRGGDDQP